jgi:hypothetical protein
LANLLKKRIFFAANKGGAKVIGLYGYLRIRPDLNTVSTTIHQATVGHEEDQSPEQQGCLQRLLK